MNIIASPSLRVTVIVLALFGAPAGSFGQLPAEATVLFERVDPASLPSAAAPAALQQARAAMGILKLREGALSVKLWANPQSFTFPLSPTLNVTTLPKMVSRSPQGNWTHTGGLNEDPSGSFVLATDGILLYGTIRHKDRDYLIQPLSPGLFTATDITNMSGECGTPEPGNKPAPAKAIKPEAPGPLSPNPNPDDGSTIDLMVAFTDDVRQALMPGGTVAQQRAAAYLAIDAMIAQTNQVYAVSGVNTRVRLVDRIEVNYAESGSADTDLNAIQNGLAPFDGMPARRDNYRADVVVLVVEGAIVDTDGMTQLNGKAIAVLTEESTNFRSSAYFTTRRVPATGAWTFAHELGHLQGCRHDQISDPGCTTCCAEGPPSVFPYSWGWQYTVNVGIPPIPQVRKTVMVRNCQNGTRQGRFSNPNVLDLGVATGNAATADNARSINETSDTVAEFQRSRLPDIYVNASYSGTETGSQAQPFNTFEEGFNHTILGGTLHLAGATYIVTDTVDLDPNDATITIDRRITIVADSGAATITR